MIYEKYIKLKMQVSIDDFDLICKNILHVKHRYISVYSNNSSIKKIIKASDAEKISVKYNHDRKITFIKIKVKDIDTYILEYKNGKTLLDNNEVNILVQYNGYISDYIYDCIYMKKFQKSMIPIFDIELFDLPKDENRIINLQLAHFMSGVVRNNDGNFIYIKTTINGYTHIIYENVSSYDDIYYQITDLNGNTMGYSVKEIFCNFVPKDSLMNL